jgi:hypothetical protein
MYALASLWRPWVWVSCTNLYRGVPLIFCIAPWGKSQCQWFWFPPFGPGGVEYLVQTHQKYILFSFTWTESHWPHTPPFNHFLTQTNAPNHADWALHSLTHFIQLDTQVTLTVFSITYSWCYHEAVYYQSLTHSSPSVTDWFTDWLSQGWVRIFVCVCACARKGAGKHVGLYCDIDF